VSASVRKPIAAVVLLNIGIDRVELRRRRQILTSAGFKVIDATSAEEALHLTQKTNVRVAIFGHRIPAGQRLEISNVLKRQNPGLRIVVMYEASAQKTELADAVLQISLPPADLVHSIEYLLADRSGRTVSHQG
jgi:DNA-binding NtrC family response regulator